MSTELTSLRIGASRLGSITEVTELLRDFETAYNGLYTFDLIVDSLARQVESQRRWSEERFHLWRRFAKEFGFRKEPLPDPFLFELLFEERFLHPRFIPKPDIKEILSTLEYDKIVLPSEVLTITKVSIRSNGFWEFLGALSPLREIREYLKDRHERSKDNRYRSRQEEELADLEIIEKRDSIIATRIETLRSLGYTDLQIRQLVLPLIIQPLNRLGRHQDNGQINGPQDQNDKTAT